MARTTRNIRHISRCALRNPATLANMRCEQAAASELREAGYLVSNRLRARRWQVTAWDDIVVSAWSEQPGIIRKQKLRGR